MTAGTTLLRPPDWTVDADCQGMAGPDLDPFDDQSPFVSVGRRICATCPVRHPCALYALREAIPHGLWGGLDPTDRRRIARKHGYPNPGAAQHGDYSRYVTCKDGPDGRACADCREAKRRYIAGRVATEGDAAIRRGRRPAPPLVLDQPHGRGRWKAWPGQVLLFDVRPAATDLRPPDTPGRSIAA